MNKHNQFEPYFRDFVTDFGGSALPEANTGDTADYLFKQHNVIAELKTLLEDSTEVMTSKIEGLIADWSRQHKCLPPGTADGEKYHVTISEMPPEIGNKWLDEMLKAISRLLEKSNRQIRDTKSREGLPNAKGVVLISNVNNWYYSNPKDFEALIVRLLRKRDSNGDIRFPNIHGVVFFSDEKLRRPDQSMGFWYSIQMNRNDGVDATEVATFQRELQQAWYRYLEKTKGIIVRQHEAL